jgi:hypothetical protein
MKESEREREREREREKIQREMDIARGHLCTYIHIYTSLACRRGPFLDQYYIYYTQKHKLYSSNLL